MWTADDTLAYLKGKGKGHRAGSSGKGFGRKGNPKDREGNTMKCRLCNSEDHFAARCPKGGGKGSSSKGQGKGGKGGSPMGFFDQQWEQWAVFAGGHTEAPAEPGGLILDDGNPTSHAHDDSMPWTNEDFALGFMAQGEEDDPWQESPDP